ncbi:probable LRR receptor-like serine/threonine-protein kinase At2g16250 [Salvia hispanica]|uniref:probable LRR receptor-like serine/threonine-protein kinase At2g16250 n=1 Tax=Salvia hispanica TaxID=49212 RepID=UPI002009A6F0|nr:probable LRR receptor-like serine/threonine-protein kinase At2g16250 [Salvia hispanica]XP_047941661.1 probable LRR receptor-like serine/threonine-protein kinase At2g16250 [Salvia hispanica]
MVDRLSRAVYIFSAFFFLLFGCTLEQQFQISRAERFALLQLRSSLGLRSREWPIKSDPCTGWVGIQCLNGSVSGINISGFRRTKRGSLNPRFSVDALRNLTFLASFNASNFALPGPIPEWLGLGVASLRVLDLRSCFINGSIPSTLGNLSSLAELYLSTNDLTGALPSSLGQLDGLSVLDLSRNALTGLIPVPLVDLRNLTVLDMSLNRLSGEIPPGIGRFSRMRYLNLSGNILSSSIPPQLGDLSSLVDLDLGSNSLSGSLPLDLRGLRNLSRLVVGDNLLSGPLPDNLFPSLTRLKFIVLGRNQFNGGVPDLLWSLPSLEFLDLSANNFTGMLPFNVSAGVNASSAVANISQNSFYGNITPVVRRFSFIDMSGNFFEGSVPISAHGSTALGMNCLRNSSNQRSRMECATFYAERNLVFDNFGEPSAPPSPPPKSDKKDHKALILASVFGGVGLIALVIFIIVLCFICKRKTGTPNQRGISVGPVPAGGSPPPPGASLNFSNLGDAFTYQQILQATGEFNDANLMKNGHSGDLYRGLLEGGIPVVVKRVDLDSSAKKESYMSELDLFSRISHPRIVPLLGHCLENENEKFLVYKHMPNGDLPSSLFKKADTEDGLQSLDWITRLKIAIGAAEGLCYLHHECVPPLVHRDVQASSILLDDKFEVRLGSLSEVCAQEGEIHQNRITRLLRLPQTTDSGASGTPNAICAYDVYCFGKVLLELVTGKLGISSSSDAAMKDWLEMTLPYISIYDKELVTNILDPSLIIDEDLLEEVWAMAIVARSCLNPKPTRRPLMRYILKALENPLKVVREDNSGSERLRTTSSRGSWNAAVFGSWRQSSIDVANVPASQKMEGPSSFKQSGTTGSQGSGPHGDANGNGHSSSARRHSREIFPEPLDEEEGMRE